MATNFRPVQEIWGEASAYFVEPEQLRNILTSLAGIAGTTSDCHDYGDMMVVWFENGTKVLDFIESDGFNVASIVGKVSRKTVASLVNNMKSLATQWRHSIGRHGELFFYIDAG